LVAVDGVDGSGKSRFASSLAAAAGDGAVPLTVFGVDDVRRPIDFGRADPVEEAALYYDRYYDFAELDRRLGDFLLGPADGAVAIVEGVLVLRARLPAETPLIVLEISLVEARRRILARDRAKGRTPEEITRRIDRRYFPAQARYRAELDPLTRADVLIDNGDWDRPRVLRRALARFPARVASALDRLLPSG
jgi:uridine kinase